VRTNSVEVLTPAFDHHLGFTAGYENLAVEQYIDVGQGLQHVCGVELPLHPDRQSSG